MSIREKISHTYSPGWPTMVGPDWENIEIWGSQGARKRHFGNIFDLSRVFQELSFRCQHHEISTFALRLCYHCTTEQKFAMQGTRIFVAIETMLKTLAGAFGIVFATLISFSLLNSCEFSSFYAKYQTELKSETALFHNNIFTIKVSRCLLTFINPSDFENKWSSFYFRVTCLASSINFSSRWR